MERDKIVEIDPAHVLVARPDPSAETDLERQQHLTERVTDRVGDQCRQRRLDDPKRVLDVAHDDPLVQGDGQERAGRACGCEQKFRARNFQHLPQDVGGLDALERLIQHQDREPRDHETGCETDCRLQTVAARIRHTPLCWVG